MVYTYRCSMAQNSLADSAVADEFADNLPPSKTMTAQEQKIPLVTVTSSENLEENTEVTDDVECQQESETQQETGALNASRPSELPVKSIFMLHDDTDSSSSPSPEEDKSFSRIASAPIVPDLELNVLKDPNMIHSQPNLARMSLLSPDSCVGGYESDMSVTSGGFTDFDDCDSHKNRSYLMLERADSDPTEVFSPRKKALKSIKSFKKSFKQKRPSVEEIKRGKTSPSSPKAGGATKNDSGRRKKLEKMVLTELALGTIKLEEGVSGIVDVTKIGDDKENIKRKRGKSKWKRKSKEQLTRVAQKLSEKQVLSPSYKQKNDDFHKFFKDLPPTERLLVDYTCALMKDILVQGRLYVSQNYLCFHSNILKWQTAVTVKLVDIDTMTKEKTVKVIPNAIQFLMKDKTKMTFTSFTARDRAYLMTFKLWQNVLLEKPMSARELWCQIHSNYGEELGLCSSDDDYVKPEYMPRKHQSIGDANGEKYEFGTTNKIKKKKKSSSATQTPPPDGEREKRFSPTRKSSQRNSSQDSSAGFHIGTDNSTGDDKSMHSSQCTNDSDEDGEDMVQEDFLQGESKSNQLEEAFIEEDIQEEDDGPAEFVLPDCSKVSLSREYNTSAADMFRIIFGDQCSFWKDTLIKKQSTEIDFGMWVDDHSVAGQQTRDISYTLKLDNPIGPKTSHCKEKQILSPNTVQGRSYGVDCTVQNYGIPYADYFQTCMRYCIRKLTKDTCHLHVTSELKYKKTPWGLIKNFIEKNVASGLSDNFTKLEVQIQERIDYEKQQSPTKNAEKGNVRRRKRKMDRAKGDGQNSPVNGVIGDGSKRPSSDLNNNEKRLSPSGDVIGAPPLHPPNGFIPSSRFITSESPKLQFFGPGGRLIAGAIFFIFLLLIYSNYSMYQRLTTLEQVTAAAATADGVDPSVTAALLDRPGVPITSSPEILSTYLQAIDKRLRRLENTMEKFTESSGKKWEKMDHHWASLVDMIQTVIKQKGANAG